MKTPLQQALHRLNEQIDTLNDVKEHAEHADAVLRFLKQERDYLTALLPTEREVIEEAYDAGHEDGDSHHTSDCETYETATNYFTTKFNDNEKTD